MEGWNDPPNVSSPKGNLKINLNKRVAFPAMTKTIPAPTTNSQATLPPLLLPPKSENPELLEDDNKQNKDEPEQLENKDDVNLSKAEVLLILNESCLKKDSPNMKLVTAKLKHLDEDWENCDYETKKILVDLTGYIKKKEAKNAEMSHRKLVMNGCRKPWLQGIRQIIMNMELAASDSTSIGNENPHEN